MLHPPSTVVAVTRTPDGDLRTGCSRRDSERTGTLSNQGTEFDREMLHIEVEAEAEEAGSRSLNIHLVFARCGFVCEEHGYFLDVATGRKALPTRPRKQ